MDLLHKKHIRAPVCSIKLCANSLVREPVATSKAGQRACTVCHMDVQVKKNTWRITLVEGHHVVSVGTPMGVATL